MKRPNRPWLPFFVRFRLIILQCLLPLIIFQFLRTLFFPTSFDVIILSLMIVTYILLLIKII